MLTNHCLLLLLTCCWLQLGFSHWIQLRIIYLDYYSCVCDNYCWIVTLFFLDWIDIIIVFVTLLCLWLDWIVIVHCPIDIYYWLYISMIYIFFYICYIQYCNRKKYIFLSKWISLLYCNRRKYILLRFTYTFVIEGSTSFYVYSLTGLLEISVWI